MRLRKERQRVHSGGSFSIQMWDKKRGREDEN